MTSPYPRLLALLDATYDGDRDRQAEWHAILTRAHDFLATADAGVLRSFEKRFPKWCAASGATLPNVRPALARKFFQCVDCLDRKQLTCLLEGIEAVLQNEDFSAQDPFCL